MAITMEECYSRQCQGLGYVNIPGTRDSDPNSHFRRRLLRLSRDSKWNTRGFPGIQLSSRQTWHDELRSSLVLQYHLLENRYKSQIERLVWLESISFHRRYHVRYLVYLDVVGLRGLPSA